MNVSAITNGPSSAHQLISSSEKKNKQKKQSFSHHKWQQTLLLHVYCIEAEQRYSTGSLQTACQRQEVLKGLTHDGTCL